MGVDIGVSSFVSVSFGVIEDMVVGMFDINVSVKFGLVVF